MRVSLARVVFLPLVFFILVVIAAVQPVQAQVVQHDTAFVGLATTQAIQVYRNAVEINAHLYTGVEYFDYRKFLREGHQFWETDEVRKGNILYEGIWYEDVPMLYDIVKDEVVIRLENRAVHQKLISEKIKQFEQNGHTFVRLTTDSLQTYRAGFYDLLINNQVQVLVHRVKIIEEVPENNLIKMVFRPADTYLIFKEQHYQQVTNKRSFFAVFKDRKKELQRYYRTNNLKFRTDKERTIVALAAFYETL
ncbi:hypothetical protein FVR03_07850 [Pontibacter qinzhouensis]|uniref:Uncharacterized protein n=1 Tax=Pontibacter qinzhouensis TaxID=2603253 RepID=A0A5C8KBQ1_9BACT|nr:hypothetical protein [Pontibacter qinzhouensis]TXK48602.1 hypothetical protein FVR03_07850 [Pontibacter qinzhouensis]